MAAPRRRCVGSEHGPAVDSRRSALLAPEYRVLAAALLSLALGGILAFAKRPSRRALAS